MKAKSASERPPKSKPGAGRTTAAESKSVADDTVVCEPVSAVKFPGSREFCREFSEKDRIQRISAG